MFNRSRYTASSVWLVGLALALFTTSVGECKESASGGQALGGGFQITGGIALIGLTQSYGAFTPRSPGEHIYSGDYLLTEEERVLAGLAVPCLFSSGIPLLITGLHTLGGRDELADPANHGLWRRVVTAQVLSFPATVFGGAIAGYSLAWILGSAVGSQFGSWVSVFLPMTAGATWASATISVVDGEHALAQLYYEEDIVDVSPGEIYKNAAVPNLILGTVYLLSGTIGAPSILALPGGPASETVILCSGAAYLITGIRFLAGSVKQRVREERGELAYRTSDRRSRIRWVGVSPSWDRHTGSRGLVLTAVF